jgi:hypothetical protein
MAPENQPPTLRAADLNALRQTVKKFTGDENSIIDMPSLRVGKPLN